MRPMSGEHNRAQPALRRLAVLRASLAGAGAERIETQLPLRPRLSRTIISHPRRCHAELDHSPADDFPRGTMGVFRRWRKAQADALPRLPRNGSLQQALYLQTAR